jgi:predicted oxidoreductase
MGKKNKMSIINKVLMAPQGPKYSEIVQGYWRLDSWNMTTKELLSFIHAHIELGITTVDNAAIYGNSEALFGEALAAEPSIRDKIQIVSKFGINLIAPDKSEKRVTHYDSSKSTILSSTERSLQRLGIEQLDTLLVHRPDILMDVDEVAQTFEALKQSGKVKHFGVSNFSASQFDLLQSRLDEPLVTNQVEISPMNFTVFEDGTADQLQQYRVRPMAWSCLAKGTIFNDKSEKAQRIRATLNDLKEEISAESVEQVIFSWILQHPSRPVPILGTGNISRVKHLTKATTLKLNTEQWYRLWVAAKGHGVA